MFTTTLVMYFTHDLPAEAIRLLCERLLTYNRTLRPDIGTVRGFLSKRRRPKGSVPIGTPYVALDLCRSCRSKPHMKTLEDRLSTVLECFETAGLLDSKKSFLRRLEMTASIGGDNDDFVRSVYLSSKFMSCCVVFNIDLRIEVVPCFDSGDSGN